METTGLSKKEYLKKYLSGGDTKKKKKKKPAQSLIIKSKIVDDDIDLSKIKVVDEDELEIYDPAEDAPQIAGIIDERPEEIRIMSEYRSTKKWKIVADEYGIENVKITAIDRRKAEDGSPSKTEQEISIKIKKNSEGRARQDSDESPPRKRTADTDVKIKQEVDSDTSPPRRPQKSDGRRKGSPDDRVRGSGTRESSDPSPPRRQIKQEVDSDASPPRRRPGRKDPDSDSSPPRKKKQQQNYDSDASPPRRKPQTTTARDGRDQRQDRLRNDRDSDRRKDRSRRRSNSRSKSRSPDRSRKDKEYGLKVLKKSDPADGETKEKKTSQLEKTLSGKKAGLQSAEEMRKEGEKLRQKEREMFEQMPDEVSGRHAEAIVRNRKTGRRHDPKEEARKRREKEEKEAEKIAQYAVWGKGVKQVQDRQEKLKDDLYEMSKPLARYKDDKDLDEMLKNQEWDGDPMLEYIRKKKAETKPSVPEYQGSYPPNRYDIKPGHKWDGVDRSNGYEKRWFEEQNARKAREEEAFKWSTADM